MMVSNSIFYYIFSLPKNMNVKILQVNKITQLFITYLNYFYIFNLDSNEFIIVKNKNLCFIPFSNKRFKFSVYFILLKLIKGFLKPWHIGLTLKGVGFKFMHVSQNKIKIKLGYSHTITYKIPNNVSLKISKKRPTKLILTGSNQAFLGQVAILIRKMRNPDSYKAKGVSFLKEIIVLKKREKFGVI